MKYYFTIFIIENPIQHYWNSTLNFLNPQLLLADLFYYFLFIVFLFFFVKWVTANTRGSDEARVEPPSHVLHHF